MMVPKNQKTKFKKVSHTFPNFSKLFQTLQKTCLNFSFFVVSRGDVMGPMNANDGTKEHDKSTDEAENSFDDNSKIDGDLTNLLNQIKEGNQLSDPFSPTNQDKEKDKGNEVFPDMSKKGNFLKTLYEKI